MEKKNIVLVSHCLLNPYSQVVSKNRTPFELKPLLDWLYENQVGVYQLPCPEMHIYGLKRWGHVREQFDNNFYRNTSRELLDPVKDHIHEYLNNGYKILGVLGINGSPSCGVDFSCSSSEWYGEISSIDSIEEKLKELEYVKSKGVFMEEFESMHDMNVSIPMYGIQHDNVHDIIKILSFKIRQE